MPDTNTQTQQSLKANPASPLNVLVGEWDTVGTHPLIPSGVHGHASFQWLEETALLVMRTHFDQPGPPNGTAVIGRDDSDGTYCMIYYDVRGVARIYKTSLEGGVWKFWRNSPGFSQRFAGTFSDDGNTIVGRGEKSSDDSNWEPDLDLTYTRVR